MLTEIGCSVSRKIREISKFILFDKLYIFKKNNNKNLIGDFRFYVKKRISKDKFGIKMLGNVYTEEINRS